MGRHRAVLGKWRHVTCVREIKGFGPQDSVTGTYLPLPTPFARPAAAAAPEPPLPPAAVPAGGPAGNPGIMLIGVSSSLDANEMDSLKEELRRTDTHQNACVWHAGSRPTLHATEQTFAGSRSRSLGFRTLPRSYVQHRMTSRRVRHGLQSHCAEHDTGQPPPRNLMPAPPNHTCHNNHAPHHSKFQPRCVPQASAEQAQKVRSLGLMVQCCQFQRAVTG